MKWYLALIPLLVITSPLFSQKTKKISEETGNKYFKHTKVYYVLADDKTIKHGPYQEYYNGSLILSGFYKMNKKDSTWNMFLRSGQIISQKTYTENKRTGIWEFTERDTTKNWQYDFTNNTLHNKQYSDTAHIYQAENGEWVKDNLRGPLWLLSKQEWLAFLNYNLRYPYEAIDKNIQGRIEVEVTIDENGDPVDYAIAESANKYLAEEALRIVIKSQLEFVPAEKDGKKVKVKIKVPITFRLEN